MAVNRYACQTPPLEDRPCNPPPLTVLLTEPPKVTQARGATSVVDPKRRLLPVQRLADLVYVGVVVLEHVRDRRPDGPRRPLRPPYRPVQVVLLEGVEHLAERLPGVGQLAAAAVQCPVAGFGHLVVVEG